MSGAFARWPSLGPVGLAAAGPDQGVGLGAFVVEEVRVDRRIEARIVELDREIIAALVGALRPRGPDLGATHVDPVARRIVAGPVCLGDDADALGLEAQGDDLALEFLAGFLERADVSHVTSPCCFRAPRPPRPRWRSESRRRSTPHPLGPKRSGGWRRGDFLASRGMGEPGSPRALARGVA